MRSSCCLNGPDPGLKGDGGIFPNRSDALIVISTSGGFRQTGLAHRGNVLAPVHHIFETIYQVLRNTGENTHCQPVDNPVPIETGNGQIITRNKTGTA